jgi:hypothetical protein
MIFLSQSFLKQYLGCMQPFCRVPTANSSKCRPQSIREVPDMKNTGATVEKNIRRKTNWPLASQPLVLTPGKPGPKADTATWCSSFALCAGNASHAESPTRKSPANPNPRRCQACLHEPTPWDAVACSRSTWKKDEVCWEAMSPALPQWEKPSSDQFT